MVIKGLIFILLLLFFGFSSRSQIGEKLAHLEFINESSAPNDSSFKYAGGFKFGIGWGILGNLVFWGGIANINFSINKAAGRAVLFFANNFPNGNAYCTSINEKAQSLFYK